MQMLRKKQGEFVFYEFEKFSNFFVILDSVACGHKEAQDYSVILILCA